MLEAVIFTLVGLFIGWNLPQPSWAKNVQEKIMNFFKSA